MVWAAVIETAPSDSRSEMRPLHHAQSLLRRSPVCPARPVGVARVHGLVSAGPEPPRRYDRIPPHPVRVGVRRLVVGHAAPAQRMPPGHAPVRRPARPPAVAHLRGLRPVPGPDRAGKQGAGEERASVHASHGSVYEHRSQALRDPGLRRSVRTRQGSALAPDRRWHARLWTEAVEVSRRGCRAAHRRLRAGPPARAAAHAVSGHAPRRCGRGWGCPGRASRRLPGVEAGRG